MGEIWGSDHFVSRRAARAYYARQGYDAADVAAKFEAGEIHVGKPAVKPGERLGMIPGEGRYAVIVGGGHG